MPVFQQLKPGDVGLVRQLEDGRIVQIGLTVSQFDILQAFLCVLSKESPLIQMGEDHDFVLKSTIKKKK